MAVWVFTSHAILFGFFRIAVVLTRISLATADGRHVRSIDILAGQTVPGDLGKPRMVLDIIGAAMEVSQALGQISRDKLRQQIDGVWVQVGRVFYPTTQDILVDLDRGATVPERRETTQHLKDQDTQGPPVNRLVVALGGNHLRGEIIGCTTKGPCDVRHLFGKTEIGDLQMAVSV
jgi:hypothetical protein